MPTATTSTNMTKSVKPADKSLSQSSTKKARTVRRRGRAKKGFESDDDEIEREARTDSETDNNSSLLSDSDSDSASDDDEHPTNSFEVLTPSTTQSPPPLHVKDASNSGHVLSIKAPLLSGNPGPFVGATDWAQMVADETAAGAGDLPVIDFSDLNEHSITQHVVSPKPHRNHKQKKQAKKAVAETVKAGASPSASVDDEQPDHVAELVASSSRPSSRERLQSSRSKGQTPRQAYQQRLEADPSYVPTVGEFWGHDDRLLDKDLRSLSGWWRGRWQSRGRGGFSMRGRRGRGGVTDGRVPGNSDQDAGELDLQAEMLEVPPIERAWTHDGFEEMKRREERRRTQSEQQKIQQEQPSLAASPPQRVAPFRGRGGFVSARGRGSFPHGGSPRLQSPPGSRSNSTFEQRPKRVWYAMPPEKSWTKHHEYALYYDHTLKPRSGQGPGIRVKLPGRTGRVIRTASRFNAAVASSEDQPSNVRASSTTAPSEDGDRAFVVRIPGALVSKEDGPYLPPSVNVLAPASHLSPVADPTAELSIEEVFTVRPNGAPTHIPIVATDVASAPLVAPQSGSPPSPSHVSSSHVSSPAAHVSHLPEPHAQHQLEQILVTNPGDASVNARIEETVLRKGPPGIHAPVPQGPGDFRPSAPVLQPIQTSFTPVSQPSPPYGSPYAYGPMPPGIAMSQHGYPYELATGRAVYLQPNPPPTMYTPRPMIPAHMTQHHSGSVPFIPGHMHHSSVASASPDFLTPRSHPHTPPMNGFVDPVTGVPIFTPARQSSRIEIRAPGDRIEGKQKGPLGPSGLRATTSGSPTSSQSAIDGTSIYYEEATEQYTDHEVSNDLQESVPGVDDYLRSQSDQGPSEAVNMAYPQYQYYYPEHYGYQPYVDPHMSSQVVQYDMYRQDPHAQPMIYY